MSLGITIPSSFVEIIGRTELYKRTGVDISQAGNPYAQELLKGRDPSGKYNIAQVDIPLTALEKELQAATLMRDYDTLFGLTGGSRNWLHPTHSVMLGKYSFQDINGKRIYIPFSESDIRRFIFSPYMNVSEGWTCSDQQKEKLVAYYLEKSNYHKRQFSNTSWAHIFPIYAGTNLCYPPKKSFWVRIRKTVYVAVGVVAAIYLGPIVFDKVGGFLAGGAEGGTAAGVTQTTSFASKVKNVVSVYNKANTVKAIVNGEIPPPPISIIGSTFTNMAVNVAKEQLVRVAKEKAYEEGIKYVQEKMTEKEEAKLRAEIEAMQREMEKLLPRDTPIMPSPELSPQDREKIAEIQKIQKKREQDLNTGLLVTVAGAGLFLLSG